MGHGEVEVREYGKADVEREEQEKKSMHTATCKGMYNMDSVLSIQRLFFYPADRLKKCLVSGVSRRGSRANNGFLSVTMTLNTLHIHVTTSCNIFNLKI